LSWDPLDDKEVASAARDGEAGPWMIRESEAVQDEISLGSRDTAALRGPLFLGRMSGVREPPRNMPEMGQGPQCPGERGPIDFRHTVTLIERAKGGDGTAFDRLCERYEGRLLERIRRMLGPEVRGFAQSMDLVQELFVDLVRDFERFEIRDDEAFLRWATGIARNNIRDLVRRHRVRRMERLATSLVQPAAGAGAEPTPLDVLDRDEQIGELHEALGRLPEDYRRVIELRDLEELSYAQIAKEMGRPSEAAAQMLHARALARLTALMNPSSR
jgi:RNA polymerase sigma factor (sigma-70 family)